MPTKQGKAGTALTCNNPKSLRARQGRVYSHRPPMPKRGGNASDLIGFTVCVVS